MNFLQLVKRTCEKCGMSGPGPAAIAGASGEYLQAINWVNESWVELQQAQRDWMFMRADFSLQVTAAGGGAYLPAAATNSPGLITGFSRWYPGTLRSYRTAYGKADEGYMVEWEYDVLRDTYLYGLQT